MGTVTVAIGVGDPQGQRFEELEVEVDTGSTYTAAPGAMLGGASGKVTPLQDRRRQDRPRKCRTHLPPKQRPYADRGRPRKCRTRYHKIGGTGVSHAGYILCRPQTRLPGRSLAGASGPRRRSSGGTPDSDQPAALTRLPRYARDDGYHTLAGQLSGRRDEQSN